MNLDPQTAEVIDEPAGMELVPLNLGAISEDDLAQLFPTPAQAMAALIQARTVLAKAPGALNTYRGKLRRAQRDTKLAVAITVKSLREDFPRATLSELRDFALVDDRVKTAIDAEDTAWLMFEYAKDFSRTVSEDVEVLRSINANLRGEHR